MSSQSDTKTVATQEDPKLKSVFEKEFATFTRSNESDVGKMGTTLNRKVFHQLYEIFEKHPLTARPVISYLIISDMILVNFNGNDAAQKATFLLAISSRITVYRSFS